MHIPESVLDLVRTQGYAVMEGFLTADEVAIARAAMFRVVPTPEEFFADPAAHHHLVAGPFAGVHEGPLPHWELNRLAFHPDLVNAAERYCGTTDLQLYKVELWAKYAADVDYDQVHHRDYGNHNLVVPRRDGRWPALTTFTMLGDVTEDDGPTMVVPRQIGDEFPMVPRKLEPGALRSHEVPVVGPAGSILLYTTDVFHRASAMRGDRASRFMLLADYSERGNPWMGKLSWPGRAPMPGMQELIERASVRERDLFGFPPPGHEYWNDQTLAETQARYPGMDITPYRPPA